jgi:exodeoxyribonuclease VII small subunit
MDGDSAEPGGDVTAPLGSREAVAVSDLGYTEAAEELDRIISELDRGVVDIDVLEDRLSRAVEIVEELDRRIKGARERVNTILPRLEAAGPGDDPGPTTV